MPSWRMEVGAEKKLENVRFGVISLRFIIKGGTRVKNAHLEASAVLPVVEARAVMSSSVGCQAWGHLAPQACCKVQLDWAHPSQSSGCCSQTVSELFCPRCI